MDSEDTHRPAERSCEACGFPFMRDEGEPEVYLLDPGEMEEYRRYSDCFCIYCFRNGRWRDAYGPFDRYTVKQVRRCAACGCSFTISEYWPDQKEKFERPHDYLSGCHNYCLYCWLVGEPPDASESVKPNAEAEEDSRAVEATTPEPSSADGLNSNPPMWEDNDPFAPRRPYSEGDDTCVPARPLPLGPNDEVIDEFQTHTFLGPTRVVTVSPRPISGWPYADVYGALMAGDVLTTYHWFFERGQLLAVMPIDRLLVNRVTTFPTGLVIYPPGRLDLRQLTIVPNHANSYSLAEIQSHASGIDEGVLSHYPLAVFPVEEHWEAFRSACHARHLLRIRYHSETIDREALDYCRYRRCRLDDMEDLPCHAGQVPSNNPMMAVLLLYNPGSREGRIVAGAAFTHCLTRGMGMPLEQPEWDQMPLAGEGTVAEIVRRGLALYTQLLEANSETGRYMQAMTLFDFLAYPDSYADFQKVWSVVIRYLSGERTPERTRLERRFHQLGSGETRVDPREKKSSGKPVKHKTPGLRHRVVHEGVRLEQMLSDEQRLTLWRELDGYLRPILDHMLTHSTSTWADYTKIREHAFTPLQGRKQRVSRGEDEDNVAL